MKRAGKRIKPKKKNRILPFFLVSIVLVAAVILVSVYVEEISVTSNDVIVENVKLDEQGALLFSLVNYKKILMDCTAVLSITDSKLVSNPSANVFFTMEKPMGVIQPKQSVKGEFSGFTLPNDHSWLHVVPNCSEAK